MTPWDYYQESLKQSDFSHDSEQEQVVRYLNSLHQRLMSQEARRYRRPFRRLFNGSRNPAVKGLYLWGGVGRGKTYLMDAFYHCLPFDNKLRLHFHRFARFIHQELEALKGSSNPLNEVAERFSKKHKVLCLDEFFVIDIADAMLLGILLQALFQRGVTLVTTSNIAPKDLYKDGLQRQQFLYAIELLEQHTEIIELKGNTDFRLQTLNSIPLYYYRNNREQQLEKSFQQLAHGQESESRVCIIEGRPLTALRLAEDVAWFDFASLCDGPRSQNDYIELSQVFHTFIISEVPQFDMMDDMARRFISLIDEFYDRRINVILSAAVPLEKLYKKGLLSAEFQRTRSRLQEMQSQEYLQQQRRSL